MAIIKKTKATNVGEGIGGRSIPYTSGGFANWWSQCGRLPPHKNKNKTKLKMELLYNPPIPYGPP